MSEALATIETTEIEAQVAPVIQSADALVVRNVSEHEHGMKMLAAVMGAETKVKSFFKPSIEAAMESKRKAEDARKQIVLLQDTVLGPVLEARKTIEKKCAAFEEEERRVAALNQKAINDEALRRQEEQRQLDAAMADTEEAAEDALTAPLPPPLTPIVKPEVAKVAGVSARETWGAEATDLKAFYRWCIETDNMYLAGEPNMIGLNSRARAEKAPMKIPGIKAVSTLSYARHDPAHKGRRLHDLPRAGRMEAARPSLAGLDAVQAGDEGQARLR